MFSPASLVVTETHRFPNLYLSSHNFSILDFLFSQFLSFFQSSLAGLEPDTAAENTSLEGPRTHKVIQASIISASVEVAANPRKKCLCP